jgi:hypothetical protein
MVEIASSIDTRLLDSRPPPASSSLKELYSIMQGCESRLGGGEGVEGIYGSITQAGMNKIFDCMKHGTSFGANSCLIDIGSGLGRPQLHAAIDPGLKKSLGIELDQVKVTKARAFITQTLDEMHRRSKGARFATPQIVCSSVEKLQSLEKATHAYSFWEGIPMSARASFGLLFRSSTSCHSVTVVQRSMRDPAKQMLELGFGPLLLIKSFPVKMSGSGASFQAYIFTKANPIAIDKLKSSAGPPMDETLPSTAAPSSIEEKTLQHVTESFARGRKRQRMNKEDQKASHLKAKSFYKFKAERSTTRLTRSKA